MSSPSWAHERSRVSGTSSELSTNPEVGFGVATSSALTTSSSSPRSGGDVKVIACLVDATDRILTKYALDLAVFQCASRGDTVFLLGLLQGIKGITKKKHKPNQHPVLLELTLISPMSSVSSLTFAWNGIGFVMLSREPVTLIVHEKKNHIPYQFPTHFWFALCALLCSGISCEERKWSS